MEEPCSAHCRVLHGGDQVELPIPNPVLLPGMFFPDGLSLRLPQMQFLVFRPLPAALLPSPPPLPNSPPLPHPPPPYFYLHLPPHIIPIHLLIPTPTSSLSLIPPFPSYLNYGPGIGEPGCTNSQAHQITPRFQISALLLKQL